MRFILFVVHLYFEYTYCIERLRVFVGACRTNLGNKNRVLQPKLKKEN